MYICVCQKWLLNLEAMIIEFTVKNFRSIKEEAILSFEANSSKSKEQNYFVIQTESEEFKLTKSIAIYGANASGKSNVITAFHALLFLIKRSHKNDVGNPLPCYEPFLFDPNTRSANCEFSISFILGSKKHKLDVKYDKGIIYSETLSYFKSKKATVLYERKAPENIEEIKHEVDFKRELTSEGVKRDVMSNQLFLSKFNTDFHSMLTPICVYFKNMETAISSEPMRIKHLNDKIAEEIVTDSSFILLKERLKRLIDIADIHVVDINVEENEETSFKFPDNFPSKLKAQIIGDNKWSIEFIHKIFDKDIESGTHALPIDEESLGTQILFGLGARVLQTLEKGGILIYDELDNSLHPRLSRLLVKLFNNTKSNPNNAQLIISTHEVSIIDKDMLRSDQIWFVEKNLQGASTLFSAQDFDGIREDMPFDKWYQAGRFGGLPTMGDIDHIFE